MAEADGSLSAGPVLALAGPTASGKSALALELAERLQATIINADALQVYRELRILSARPDAAAEARVPHRLYGVLSGAEACSAGRWRTLALAEIAAARTAGRLPLLVGGTGLYLEALERGLAAVPPVPEATRAEAQALFDRLGPAAFHAALAERDPEMAARLKTGDRQRLLRAWKVLQATGRSLAAWQRETAGGFPLTWIVLLPPREALRAAAAERFAALLRQGALEEVRALLALNLDPALPVMKAVGVPELAAVLDGRATLAEAEAAAVTATRQYLKRQTTWLRTRVLTCLPPPLLWDEKFSDQTAVWCITNLRKTGLIA